MAQYPFSPQFRGGDSLLGTSLLGNPTLSQSFPSRPGEQTNSIVDIPIARKRGAYLGVGIAERTLTGSSLSIGDQNMEATVGCQTRPLGCETYADISKKINKTTTVHGGGSSHA